jgi:uncharacterized protein YdeI (BOF family)
MKFKFLSILAIIGICTINANAMDHKVPMNNDKPISKVSDIATMPDDSVVYIQGMIVQDLGDENYLFKDNTGTINIEIDEELVDNNKIVGEAMMFITATVDKDGNITTLDAEEIDIIPMNNNTPKSPAKSNVKHPDISQQ